ncbi:diamine acetyltransferase 2b isoform X3 [Thalassophryne amazonica]|uniref:diamine acetyltransferase 2b isoform X3 n=1 Tax=Thalassophryne amazonica TaxID=390379 RepID=UPI001472331F|nr:diamine acetyltransferase 2b isoform X3 [Thalassophryne amazonica]
MNFKVRVAKKEDCKDIARMIMVFQELSIFEKMSEQVKITHTELERDGFCQNPLFECLVAEVLEEHKSKEGFTVVGYALYFYTYSTWKGRSVYLEDLYVMPEFRGVQSEAVCEASAVCAELEHSKSRLLRCQRCSGPDSHRRLALCPL